MTIELSEPMQQAIDAAAGETVVVVDPRTRKQYVLLPSELWAQVLLELDGDVDRHTTARLIEREMAEEDAGDPWLASYQQYRRPE